MMAIQRKQLSLIWIGLIILLVTSTLSLSFSVSAAGLSASPDLSSESSAEISQVTPEMLAVIVNTQDTLSQEIAAYYQQVRKIPDENIIEISFDPTRHKLSKQEFLKLKQDVDASTPEKVQFYALTWANTYRVECMSITSAFTFGFDEAYSRCKSSCERTKTSPYFYLSDLSRPFEQLAIRPAMMLAADNFSQAKALIDRGVAADGLLPKQHQAFLIKTQDTARNIRKAHYLFAERSFGDQIEIYHTTPDQITTANFLMFYFTGAKSVYGIEQQKYLPGAIADHLTSSAGQITNSKQMSALEWLKAGATGSYGTVVEPCNHLGKFPNPFIVMNYYLKGHTLIEAYWKSVLMPGQGVFIGEPLARPYAH
ncbi:MAG: TIGR03790 family protein [Neptuniibacter sp.]